MTVQFEQHGLKKHPATDRVGDKQDKPGLVENGANQERLARVGGYSWVA